MRARKFYEAHFVPVAFEMRERVFGALFAPSAESFTALPFSIKHFSLADRTTSTSRQDDLH